MSLELHTMISIMVHIGRKDMLGSNKHFARRSMKTMFVQDRTELILTELNGFEARFLV